MKWRNKGGLISGEAGANNRDFMRVCWYYPSMSRMYNVKPGSNKRHNDIRAKSHENAKLKFMSIFYVTSRVNISDNANYSCNLHYVIYFPFDNGVMTTPKRWILSFVFTVLCLKKSLLRHKDNNVKQTLSMSLCRQYEPGIW